jgi:hypothetical protein
VLQQQQSLRSSKNFSGYGNSGISSGVGGCEGVIDLGDEGVIGFGDEGGVIGDEGVIGFGDEGGVIGDEGVIGFGDEGGVIGDEGVIGDVVVSFLVDFGRPQTSDSVELTNSSFGLLGSHICAFISGDMVVVPAEPGGEGGGGGGGTKGSIGDIGDDCSSCWAWLTLIMPIPSTALTAAAATITTTANNAILTDLTVVFIFIWYTYMVKTNI